MNRKTRTGEKTHNLEGEKQLVLVMYCYIFDYPES